MPVLVFQNALFLLSILSSSAIFHSFAKRRFFAITRRALRNYSAFSKTIFFSRRASQLFAVFKNNDPRSCRFPKSAFSAVSAASIIVFQYFTLSPRRDPFCFPKSAFIAPMLPILNSFQIPCFSAPVRAHCFQKSFFSACSAVSILVFKIISFLPSAMIVFKYHDFLFSRLSFLKSIVFCFGF